MEVLRMRGDGLVGIGTQNPSQKLDVNGNVKAQRYYDDNTNYWLDMNDYSNIRYVTVEGFHLPNNAGAGKVLVSDGDGWAYWANPCWAVRNCACN